MIDKMISLIREIKDLSWWALSLITMFFITYTFQDEIVRVIDLEIVKKDVVIHSIENDVRINTALNDLLIDTKSDRAYIFRFHNGVKYYNGSHKGKMSCDYEVVKRGISREGNRLQNMPTALYADWLLEVLEYKMFYPDISLMTDLRAKADLEVQGIKGIGVLPYYRNGNLFALIGIDYVNDISEQDKEDFEQNKKKNIEALKIRANGIGDLLL